MNISSGDQNRCTNKQSNTRSNKHYSVEILIVLENILSPFFLGCPNGSYNTGYNIQQLQYLL